MDLINTGTDPWILEQEACEVLNRDILEQLNERSALDVQSKEYDACSAKILIRLKQFTSQVEQLNEKLKLASIVSSITAEENERRRRQVDILQSNIFKLQDEFNRRSRRHSQLMVNEDRSRLLGHKNQPAILADMGTTSWGDVGIQGRAQENQGTSSKTVDELRVDQKRMLREQDEGLESLSKIISRQKHIAGAINMEVDHHNEILDDMSQDMTRIEGRMQRETNMVRIIGKKDTTWGYWLVIILLLIAIIGVAVA